MDSDPMTDDELLDEYDFATLKELGPRGAFAERYRAGTNLVRLDPDIDAVFQSTDAVNSAWRSLIDIARHQVLKAS